jgi:hypothetical protein
MAGQFTAGSATLTLADFNSLLRLGFLSAISTRE